MDGLSGPWGGSDGFALGTVMVIFLLIGAAQQSRSSLKKYAVYRLVPLAVLSVVFTHSRGGFLALCTSMVLFALLQPRPALTLGALALAATVDLAVATISNSYLARWRTIRTYEEVGDDSAMGRLHFWRVAVEMA